MAFDMSFEEYGKKYLEGRGMFDDQASAVIELAKQEGALADTLGDAWRNNVDEYPDGMKVSFIVALNDVALKWIDANIPQAWFRGCFR